MGGATSDGSDGLRFFESAVSDQVSWYRTAAQVGGAGDVVWRGMWEREEHTYKRATKPHTNSSVSIEGCC
jgi:hypothetical protein